MSNYVWRSSLSATRDECLKYGLICQGSGQQLKRRLVTHLTSVAKKQLARDLRIQYGSLKGVNIQDLRPELVELQKCLCILDPALVQVPIEIRLQELKTLVAKYPGIPVPYRKLMPAEGTVSVHKANGHYCDSCSVVCFCTALRTPSRADRNYAVNPEWHHTTVTQAYYQQKVRNYELITNNYDLARSEWENAESLKTSPSWVNASKLVENAHSVCAIMPYDMLEVITGFVADLKINDAKSIYQKKQELCKEVTELKTTLRLVKWQYDVTKQRMRINFYTARMNVLGKDASNRVIKNHTERMRKFNQETLGYAILTREFDEVRLMADELGVKEGIYGDYAVVM